MNKAPNNRRRRETLSAERIATEAMALVDESGLEGLSFRALGKRMGCEAMSLYHYYPSKQHLIDALVNICIAETPVPEPGPSPRERLKEFCMRYRATVLLHPGFAPVFTTHRLNHREGLAWLDESVQIFSASDAPMSRKAELFRVISYFMTGAVLDEALGYAKGPSAADPVPGDEAKRDYPHILGIGAYFGQENHLRFYETGLDVLLDWVEENL